MNSHEPYDDNNDWEIERLQLLSQIQTLQEENFNRQNETIRHQNLLLQKLDSLKSENQHLRLENQRLLVHFTRSGNGISPASVPAFFGNASTDPQYASKPATITTPVRKTIQLTRNYKPLESPVRVEPVVQQKRRKSIEGISCSETTRSKKKIKASVINSKSDEANNETDRENSDSSGKEDLINHSKIKEKSKAIAKAKPKTQSFKLPVELIINGSDLITQETLDSLKNVNINYSALTIPQLITQIDSDFKEFFTQKLTSGTVFSNHTVLDKALFLYFSLCHRIPIISIQKTKYKKYLTTAKIKTSKPQKDIYQYLCMNCRTQIFQVSNLAIGGSVCQLDYISHNHKCNIDVTIKSLITMRKKSLSPRDKERGTIAEIEKNLSQFAKAVNGDSEMLNLCLYAISFKLVDLNYLSPLMLSLIFEYYGDVYSSSANDLPNDKGLFKKLKAHYTALFVHIYRFDNAERLLELQNLVLNAEKEGKVLELVASTANMKRLKNCDFIEKYSKMVRTSIIKGLKNRTDQMERSVETEKSDEIEKVPEPTSQHEFEEEPEDEQQSESIEDDED